mmetsp:Transcript_68420/g.192970  ORF Transcript_68420/g.192970 Transcript_68420/m.192970 type:complete len:228 (+) Transcript_68420:2702-3385(+)
MCFARHCSRTCSFLVQPPYVATIRASTSSSRSRTLPDCPVVASTTSEARSRHSVRRAGVGIALQTCTCVSRARSSLCPPPPGPSLPGTIVCRPLAWSSPRRSSRVSCDSRSTSRRTSAAKKVPSLPTGIPWASHCCRKAPPRRGTAGGGASSPAAGPGDTSLPPGCPLGGRPSPGVPPAAASASSPPPPGPSGVIASHTLPPVAASSAPPPATSSVVAGSTKLRVAP